MLPMVVVIARLALMVVVVGHLWDILLMVMVVDHLALMVAAVDHL